MPSESGQEAAIVPRKQGKDASKQYIIDLKNMCVIGAPINKRPNAPFCRL